MVMKQLAALILLFGVCTGQPAYHLRFQPVNSDGRYFDVMIQASGSDVFANGGANIVFEFDTRSLSDPVLLTVHHFESGKYAPMNISRPALDAVSVNIEFDGERGAAETVPASPEWVDIATIRFTVRDAERCSSLAFRGSGETVNPTVLFLDDMQTMVREGTLSNLMIRPLPLALLSFSGRYEQDAVRLAWKTANAQGTRGFGIERSEQGHPDWSEIGIVQSRSGSSGEQEYEFNDTRLPASDLLYYRLRQVSDDGTIAYSNTLQLSRSTPSGLELYQNYPNPVQSFSVFPFYLPADGYTELLILDSSGKEVRTILAGNLGRGYQTAFFTANGLASGAYRCVIKACGATQTRAFTVTK
jgi:hypothetical protein